jgi:hypothetical protein
VVDVIVQLLKYGLVLGLIVAWASILLPPVVRFVGGRVGRGADSIGSFRSNMDRLGGGSRRASLGGTVLGGTALGGTVLDLTDRGAAVSLDVARVPSDRLRRVSARKRRRDILVGLLATTGVMLLGGLVVGGLLWALFGLTFVLLAGYVGLLWTMQQAHLERQNKVAYLPREELVSQPHAQLRRVSSSRA